MKCETPECVLFKLVFAVHSLLRFHRKLYDRSTCFFMGMALGLLSGSGVSVGNFGWH